MASEVPASREARSHSLELRRTGAHFARTGEYSPTIFPAGANRMNLGRRPVGRSPVGLDACHRSRGCAATRFVGFRIR